ncbi:unnamed protein product [Peniophora sp. CBMAI 1063]|nr:unnamed protein product [Peniophora sp. CBMAI 1063]
MSASSPSAGTLDEQFNSTDADISLRSSDGVIFAVHSFILRWISPFFADMLSLPQTSDSAGDQRPVIDMSEDSASIRTLLRFSYPHTFCADPELEKVADIKRAAVIARKFDCQALLEAVESAIIRLSKSESETAYALAWRFEFPGALRAAARASVHHRLFIDDGREVPEFDELPARALVLLGRYRTSFYDATLRLDQEIYPHPTWIAKHHATGCRELQLDVVNGIPVADGIDFDKCTCEKSVAPDLERTIVHAVLKAVHTARKEARGCPRCCAIVDHDDLFTRTARLLQEEIERQLDKVVLQPPF